MQKELKAQATGAERHLVERAAGRSAAAETDPEEQLKTAGAVPA